MAAQDNSVSFDEVTKAVQRALGTQQVEVKTYDIRPASETPLGFFGEHIRIKVTVNVSGNESELQFFGKMMPTKVAAHREYIESTRAFYKEIELYKTLFDDMLNALTEKGTTRQWRPQSYFTRDWDLMIVEDLSTQNYYMLPERTLMGLEYVEITVQTMARMHAGSLIFEEMLNHKKATTHSKLFTGQKASIRDLYPNLIFESECTNEPGHPGFKFWEVGIESQVGIVDLLDHYTPHEKKIIKERFPDIMRKVYELVKPSDKFRNVMVHGDLWGNNILFKNGADGKVSTAILVDFQNVGYTPPAFDLLMFLHLVQNQTFRDEHEKGILQLYYDALSTELSNEGLDIANILPRTEFDDSCNFYRQYGVINQIIYTQLNIAPADVCTKFLATPELYNKINFEDRTEMLIESFKTDAFCKERTIEAMDNVIRLFKLNVD